MIPSPCALPTLTTVRSLEGIRRLRPSAFTLLKNRHGIEVGGGLGTLAGKVWRIGLMGYNRPRREVDSALSILLETEFARFSLLPADAIKGADCRRAGLNQLPVSGRHPSARPAPPWCVWALGLFARVEGSRRAPPRLGSAAANSTVPMGLDQRRRPHMGKGSRDTKQGASV